MTDLNKLINFSPPVWPGKEDLTPQPGDLTKFMPNGYNCDEDFFGEKKNPFVRMPSAERVGGAICFDSDVYRKDKKAFMLFMKAFGMWENKKFVAFIKEENDYSHTYCAKQMRLVSDFALQYAFKAIGEKEYNSFPEQKVTMAEAFWAFLQEETRGCDPPKNVSPGKTTIIMVIPPSIGIMVENSYHGIYRIWSRWPEIPQ
jgi:hypothetical protein